MRAVRNIFEGSNGILSFHFFDLYLLLNVLCFSVSCIIITMKLAGCVFDVNKSNSCSRSVVLYFFINENFFLTDIRFYILEVISHIYIININAFNFGLNLLPYRSTVL